MEDLDFPIEVLENAIIASRKHNRPIELVRDGLRILSERKPLMKNGEQLQLSTGPAWAQDYLWHAHYDRDSQTWEWDKP